MQHEPRTGRRTTEPKNLVGVFVGGQSRRMGGRPKGLLPVEEGAATTILERLVVVAHDLGCEVVLVGEASPYAGSGLAVVDDAVAGAGPLGGLAGLLARAARDGADGAIAIACDMPFVTPEALARLLEAPRGPAIVAARRDAHAPWEGLFARYAISVLPHVRSALAEGERSLQALFARVASAGGGLADLAVDDVLDAALVDWDSEEDRANRPRP